MFNSLPVFLFYFTFNKYSYPNHYQRSVTEIKVSFLAGSPMYHVSIMKMNSVLKLDVERLVHAVSLGAWKCGVRAALQAPPSPGSPAATLGPTLTVPASLSFSFPCRGENSATLKHPSACQGVSRSKYKDAKHDWVSGLLLVSLFLSSPPAFSSPPIPPFSQEQ